MATILFISTEDIKKLTPMGGNVDTDKYNQSIYDMQQAQLLPIIGQDLYDRIVSEFGAPTAPITALVDGPMRNMLALYAVADWALLSNYTMDNSGTSTHRPDNANPGTTDEVIRNTERLEDKAKMYGQQLIKFLQDNQSDYPEWKGSSTNSNYFGWDMGDGGSCW